jgi:hypothetical protein
MLRKVPTVDDNLVLTLRHASAQARRVPSHAEQAQQPYDLKTGVEAYSSKGYHRTGATQIARIARFLAETAQFKH